MRRPIYRDDLDDEERETKKEWWKEKEEEEEPLYPRHFHACVKYIVVHTARLSLIRS